MTRVLFGQSYYLRFDPKLWQTKQPYPPLGSLYAASYVRQKSYDVVFFDAMLATSEQEWTAAITQHRPEYAVIFEDNFNYLSKMCLLRMRQAAFTMAEAAKAHGCTVIVCGSDATDNIEAYMQSGIDYVLMGEGEVTLLALLDHLTGNRRSDLSSIMGLAWKGQGGDIWKNTPRPVLQNLDKLPFPAWDLIDVPKYRKIWYDNHGYYSVNMVTTRGCPYHCNWCAKPIWGQRYNVRSPENVLQEMLWLKNNYHPDHIWFADDIFGLKPGWIQAFAALLDSQNIDIPFKSLSRADLLLIDDTIAAFKRAGCQTVWLGAESGSQKILDAMEKGISVQQIYQATDRLQDAGIKVAFFIQFGYPEETRHDIEQTLQMIRDCRPDDIGISVSYPLPGTKFYDRVKEQLETKQNWQDSDDLAMLYQGPFRTAFYRKLHTVVHKEFRYTKFLSEIRSVITRPTAIRLIHGKRLLMAYYYKLTLPLARLQLRLSEKTKQKPTVLTEPASS